VPTQSNIKPNTFIKKMIEMNPSKPAPLTVDIENYENYDLENRPSYLSCPSTDIESDIWNRKDLTWVNVNYTRNDQKILSNCWGNVRY
jgi:hypothetical protein